jgi:hypothetical protein
MTPTASPEPTGPPATATPAPPDTPAATSAAPTATPAPPPAPPATVIFTPSPVATLVEWETYSAALRPAVRQDLDPVLNASAAGLLSGMTQYSLTVDIPADLSVIRGKAEIRYTNREGAPLSQVYLHLFPNLWRNGMLVQAVMADGQPAITSLRSDDSLLQVALEKPLLPGNSVELALNFTQPIPAGTNVGNYGEFAYLGDVLALAHFYPTVVVYDPNPGWHLETPAPQGDVIYHDASLYDVRLTLPATMTVAATGATLGRTEHGDGTVTWRLAGGPLRDFNVVASSRFEAVSKQVGDVKVTSYFLPEHKDGGQKALGWAAAALWIYETAIGLYPYAELDVTETGTTAGGIEYPGLIVVAGRFYDDPDPTRRSYFESATVHEVGHQWWYNVVGNDQVNAPWLDEALAQYTTYLYFRETYGKEGGENFIKTVNGRWARMNYEEKPIGLPVAAYTGAEYSSIVYGRGALFFIALRDRIGEKMMAAFLRRYYAEYAWRIATPEEFRKLAEDVSGQDLGDLFRKWVYPR